MGGTIYATKRGPVLGKALHLIKGHDIAKSDEWARHIRILPQTRCIRLIHFPENFRLWSEQKWYLYGLYLRSGLVHTRASTSERSNAFPRFWTLWINWKKPT